MPSDWDEEHPDTWEPDVLELSRTERYGPRTAPPRATREDWLVCELHWGTACLDLHAKNLCHHDATECEAMVAQIEGWQDDRRAELARIRSKR